MIIRLTNPQSNFVILSKSVTEDKNLSWAARGLLVFLLGKPSDWKISIEHLALQTKNTAKYSGKDSIYSLLQELMTQKYVIRSDKQSHDENGRLCGYDYVVYDSPCRANTDKDSPCLPLPYKAEPCKANPPLISNELEQGMNINKNNISDEVLKKTNEPKNGTVSEQDYIDKVTTDNKPKNFALPLNWSPDNSLFGAYCLNNEITPNQLTNDILKSFCEKANAKGEVKSEAQWCLYLARYLKTCLNNPVPKKPNPHIYRPTNGHNPVNEPRMNIPVFVPEPAKPKIKRSTTALTDIFGD